MLEFLEINFEDLRDSSWIKKIKGLVVDLLKINFKDLVVEYLKINFKDPVVENFKIYFKDTKKFVEFLNIHFKDLKKFVNIANIKFRGFLTHISRTSLNSWIFKQKC